LTAAREIRKLAEDGKYVLVVEHDLAILDLMCDYGCVLYGQSGAYGVITSPYPIKSAINIFLDGYIPAENMRFRESSLKFEIQDTAEYVKGTVQEYSYPGVTLTLDGFRLSVEEGSFASSEITVLLGENGMGKSMLVKMMAGIEGNDQKIQLSKLLVSHKPQKIVPKYKGTLRNLLLSKIHTAFTNQMFYEDVVKPLGLEYALDQEVQFLSGGEIQRTAIIICLGVNADLYLLDEPSAFLDADQRIAVAKVLKRFICSRKKSAFVVEHDLIVSTYLADKIVVFSGTPGLCSRAHKPVPLLDGMNSFLKDLDITFRRDPENSRPRVNKPESAKDKEQKKANKYFFV
jgi:ATP-binding cassette subfamily E protein 1